MVNLKPEKYLSNRGQSLMEIVIALGIFALIAASISSLILGSLSLSGEGGIISQADMLAQEGLEAVRSIKDRAWNELIFNKSAVNSAGGIWQFTGEGSSEQIGIFNRIIEFYPVYRDSQNMIASSGAAGAWLDKESKEVRVAISWQNARNKTSFLYRNTYLTNWDSYTWTQTDWSAGSGQNLYEQDNKYFIDDGNINASISGEIMLKEIASSTFATEGYIISSAYDIGPNSAPSLIFADWEAPEECVDCNVKIQIKSAPDINGSPGTWTATWSGEDGIDGDETDYYLATSSGAIINTDHNSDEWFRYKVILLGENNYTPVLKQIVLDYKR